MDFARLVYVVVLGTVFLPGAGYAGSLPKAGGKHNAHTPIDVTSDTLEVMQEKNQAVFSGHVVAIQGDVRLKADKMTVYYAKPEDKAQAHKATKTAGKQSHGEGAIKKIDADGNVFLATLLETASGASGTYDVVHQEIHLNDHVVLTRGQNVLKGDRLTYNFATGKSKLTGGEEQADHKGKGRVHALFVPENKDKETR